MALDPNSKYLRQVTTGQVYGWDPEFAKRSDMVEYRPGSDLTGIEVITIDTRVKEELPVAVAVTPDAFQGRGGVMGAILGEG